MVFVVFHTPRGEKTTVNTDNIKNAMDFDWQETTDKLNKDLELNNMGSEHPEYADWQESFSIMKNARTNLHCTNGDTVYVRETQEEIAKAVNAALREILKPGVSKTPPQPEGPGDLRKHFG